MRKVVDTFTFFNEIDLLKLRLAELNDVVDTFVLVEATLTFSGLPKPLYFQDNKHLFEPYLHKIVHVIVDDLPKENTWTWTRESMQRNAIWRGVAQLSLQPDDIFMWMDVDEIPDSQRVVDLKTNGLPGGIHVLPMDMYYYNVTCKSPNAWPYARVCEFGVLGPSPDLDALRKKVDDRPALPRGGWHLSYFGDAEFIRKKIQSFSHDEFNTDYFTDVNRISQRIASGGDLFDRGYVVWEHIPIDANTYLPKFVDLVKM